MTEDRKGENKKIWQALFSALSLGGVCTHFNPMYWLMGV